jgi:hypothetical protein
MASSGLLRHNIPEDAILHNHRRENLKSYTWQLLLLLLRPDMGGLAVANLVEALCNKLDGHGFESRRGHCIFLYLHNSSSFTKNFSGIKRGWRVTLTSLPTLSRMSRSYGSLDASECYGSARPVTETALVFHWNQGHSRFVGLRIYFRINWFPFSRSRKGKKNYVYPMSLRKILPSNFNAYST